MAAGRHHLSRRSREAQPWTPSTSVSSTASSRTPVGVGYPPAGQAFRKPLCRVGPCPCQSKHADGIARPGGCGGTAMTCGRPACSRSDWRNSDTCSHHRPVPAGRTRTPVRRRSSPSSPFSVRPHAPMWPPGWSGGARDSPWAEGRHVSTGYRQTTQGRGGGPVRRGTGRSACRAVRGSARLARPATLRRGQNRAAPPPRNRRSLRHNAPAAPARPGDTGASIDHATTPCSPCCRH